MGRHSTEENNEFSKTYRYYFLFMSYHNKQALLARLEEEPINIVSYGGSKDLYKQFIEIMEEDVYSPILDQRVVELDITKTGGEMNGSSINGISYE